MLGEEGQAVSFEALPRIASVGVHATFLLKYTVWVIAALTDHHGS
jgi:hypothetical protein